MKRWGLFLIIVMILSMVPAWMIKPVTATDSILTAIDDAYSYYKDGETFNWKDYYYDSFYGDYVLYVGNSSSYQKERAYLKFDLSELPTNIQIESASLCIYVTYVKNGPFDIGLYTTTNNWAGSETPDAIPEPIELVATATANSYNTWYCFDVSDFMANLDLTDNHVISFIVKLVDESLTNNYLKISSTDASDNRPYLNVEYTLPKNVQITNVEAPKVVWKGEKTNINVTVQNNDEFDYSNLNLTISVNGKVIYENTTFSIGKNEEKTVGIPWTPEGLGTHEISVILKDEDGSLLSQETAYVEVGVVTSIQEIQSNTEDGDASVYEDILVKTYGVVTFVTDYGFTIQNGTGPWSGIWVYTGSTPPVKVGDYVSVQALVEEHYHFTELNYKDTLTDQRNIEVLGTAEVPDPVILPTGDVAQEQWEGVLVEVRDVKVVNPNLSYGEWSVDDGSGPVRIDDKFYDYTPSYTKYDYIRGIVWYPYGNFKIEPRYAEDIKPHIPDFNVIAHTLVLYYDKKYMKHKGELDQLYEQFTDMIEELQEYGVDLTPIQRDIEAIQANVEEINSLHQKYESLSGYKEKGYYIPLMIPLRKATVITEETIKMLEHINPILNSTLEQVKAMIQQQNMTSENATIIENITIKVPKLVKVLIDSGHNQYYNADMMSGLINRIKNELNWTVDVNYGMLTYEKLKDYDILIITNPGTDITDEEAQAIKQWVKEGGGLFILGDWHKYIY
ncbi:DNRLRE domain-containing protein [Thermococcus sp. LS2]|nr:DNRLRE domain-containing protein [Thermococcus sp. LS2]NJE12459.1 DNRLRE domain-containing protein [Thermococcus sp. LS2]